MTRNRPVLDDFLKSRTDLEYVRPIRDIVFCRLRSGNVDRLYRLLMEKYETCVAPGRFFDMPRDSASGSAATPR